MSSSEFKVAHDFRPLSTRENGRDAHVRVLCALETDGPVTLDFTGARPSPSFADELVGGLVVTLGREEFLRRVRVVGLDAGTRALLNQVAVARARQGRGARTA